MRPASSDAYRLLHEGTLALSAVEANGVKIDTDYLERTIRKTKKRIKTLETSIKESNVYAAWRKRFRGKMKFSARQQLATVLFDDLGYKSEAQTASGLRAMDQTVLMQIDHPFVKGYIELERMKKVLSTNLLGIKRELVDGVLRSNYGLNIPITYRGQSDSPNFQNFPIRIEELARIVRKCIVAPKGFHIAETDYSGIEVRVSACYNKDPVLIKYLTGSGDMHRDTAADCYMCKPSEVSDKMRYCAKNQFVFPEFYGSYFAQCAPNLWKSIKLYHGETDRKTGKPEMEIHGMRIDKWLKKKGIRGLGGCEGGKPKPGTFEAHIKDVEKIFWEERFKVYAGWKEDWYDTYLSRGWMRTKTGFILQGIYKKNDIINYPIQGSAFHCLLWSLIQLQKMLVKKKMKSRIVGQIHDSILAYVHRRERDDYLHMVKLVTTVLLPQAWTWINIPLDIEAKFSEVAGSWFDVQEVKL